MRIWKIVIETPNRETFRLPRGSVILSAQAQRGAICVWFRHEQPDVADFPEEEHEFAVFGTGWDEPMPPGFEFLGTVLLENDTLVFHVFHKGPK